MQTENKIVNIPEVVLKQLTDVQIKILSAFPETTRHGLTVESIAEKSKIDIEDLSINFLSSLDYLTFIGLLKRVEAESTPIFDFPTNWYLSENGLTVRSLECFYTTVT